MLDLKVKLGLATEEVTQETLDFILHRAGGSDPQGAGRRQAGVRDVVVTRQLKRWHALHTLEIAYRDAFHNQLNDRYKDMFLEYKRLAEQARTQTFQFGVGVVHQPLPSAPAPNFSFVTGSFEATTYYARVTWVNAVGQEGAPGEITTYDAPAGSRPVVGMIGAPPNAVAFNVYLGLTPETLSKQNGSPIAIGQTFTLPGSGLVAGTVPGDGQAPDLYLVGSRVMRRG
jgi:hypothetical protein